MKKVNKTRSRLNEELVKLRRRVARLENEKSKRKRVEQVLKKSEEWLKNILAASPDAITVTDLKGNIVECNQATLKLHHFSSKDEVIGRNAIELIAKKDHKRALENLEKTPSLGSQKNIEYTFLAKDGREFPVELSASVIKNLSGKPINFVVITEDITERKRAEEELKAALKEKEVLLREIHHRVKNNMQIISSLLKLQSENIENEEMIKKFKDSQSRIKAMTIVHEKLYQSTDLTKINFNEYVKTLVRDLFRSYGVQSNSVAFMIGGGDISLNIDTAIPCGLIINELISNSLKYAFRSRKKGRIYVSLKHLDKNKIALTVRDNGIGIPKDLDLKTTKSLGLRLVNILAEDQLKGELILNRSAGAEFKIIFEEGS